VQTLVNSFGYKLEKGIGIKEKNSFVSVFSQIQDSPPPPVPPFGGPISVADTALRGSELFSLMRVPCVLHPYSLDNEGGF